MKYPLSDVGENIMMSACIYQAKGDIVSLNKAKKLYRLLEQLNNQTYINQAYLNDLLGDIACTPIDHMLETIEFGLNALVVKDHHI